METATAYIRVGKNRPGHNRKPYRIDAAPTVNRRPFEDNRGRIIPTLFFAVELELPEDAFKGAARVIAKLKVPEEKLEIAAEVVEVEE